MRRNNIRIVKFSNRRLSNSLTTVISTLEKGKFNNIKINFERMLGVPKKAKTTNTRRKAFHLIVFFMSTAGFIWQTYTFLEIYLNYPVIQYVTKEYPEVISAPAVTLCTRNRIKRQAFCQALPHTCEEWPLYRVCRHSKTHCPAVIPENYDLKFRSVYLDKQKNNYNQSNEFLQALGLQSQWELLEKCTIEKSAGSITCNESIMIQVPYSGLPYKCFAFFSLIDEPNKYAENFSLSDYYSFRLNLHPEDQMFGKYLTSVYVSVHDPRRLKNPIAEYIAMQAGYSYRLYVTIQHTQNMPPPYETNCVDYLTSWKQNGGRGPLSKKECIQFCMMDAMMGQRGCLSKAIVYPNNFTLCPRREKDNYSEEMMAKCESGCHEGCEDTEYFVTQEISDNLKVKLCNETDVHCKSSYLNFEVRFNRMTEERLYSEPMYASEELFSHIGGYLGLWLGISLITLFDSIEVLLDIIMYPVVKGRKIKTRVVSYADGKHNK